MHRLRRDMGQSPFPNRQVGLNCTSVYLIEKIVCITPLSNIPICKVLTEILTAGITKKISSGPGIIVFKTFYIS